jgi:WXG100 family type VII secretion target
MAVQTIDTVAFDDAISSLNAAIATFKDVKTRIKSETDTLLDTWHGEGRNAFFSVYDRLLFELEDNTEVIETICNDLINIKASYEETDNSIKAQMEASE